MPNTEQEFWHNNSFFDISPKTYPSVFEKLAYSWTNQNWMEWKVSPG